VAITSFENRELEDTSAREERPVTPYFVWGILGTFSRHLTR
jgi:hypothetical protein